MYWVIQVRPASGQCLISTRSVSGQCQASVRPAPGQCLISTRSALKEEEENEIVANLPMDAVVFPTTASSMGKRVDGDVPNTSSLALLSSSWQL
ncbi:hypothetical protein PoB_000666000 [Plakobranchus ocellatus]|uniref:Uncharacterized protein n=1 Tax=Plakobranchus ocellatus TaxID=259542 RepID=A0AAV3YCC1_9GAST|nr:hypothetical protein PoB_000666000 [Plakobranchus ocellatus]